jgi:acyl dehydratase
MAGVWFDALFVGQVFEHAIRRTVTETDNVLFTAMTHNPAQLHLDEEYMKLFHTWPYGRDFGR